MKPKRKRDFTGMFIMAVLLSGRKWLDHPERGEELG